MLLVTHATLIPVSADTSEPEVIRDGWMLVDDDGLIDSIGSGTPPGGWWG